MDKLCPLAQVVAIIGLVMVSCVFILALCTDFFDNFGKKK